MPYSVLVERMRQGAAMLDAQGAIIYCNQSLADLLGVEREMAIGMPLWDLLAEEDEGTRQRLVRDSQVGASEGEMRLQQADDHTFPRPARPPCENQVKGPNPFRSPIE